MEDETVHLRPAERRGTAALLAMIGALAAHHGDTARVDAATLERDVFAQEPWLRVMIAEARGRPVGYVALCPMAQLQFGARGLDIHHLFVATGHRGKGIGRALIDGALETARHLGCLTVTVGTQGENREASAIYRAAGFEVKPTSGARFIQRLAPEADAPC